jgi:glycosyltransferase involved in cell wall biosynthesis
MKEIPKITVITPSLNQGAFIERTIRSVLEQGYPDLEYIIVDGGSSDQTLDILKKYEGRLRWISEKDNGQSDAINKGLRMAAGDILAYLNSDDIYEQGALKVVSEQFASDPSLMWLTGRCRIVDEDGVEIRRLITAYKNFLLDHYSYNLLLTTNPVSQPATFWRREMTGEIGLFDLHEHLAMDYEYWLRMGKKYRPMIVKRYLAHFRVHQKSKTSSSFLSTFSHEVSIAERYSGSTAINFLHRAHYYLMLNAYRGMNFMTRLRRRR